MIKSITLLQLIFIISLAPYVISCLIFSLYQCSKQQQHCSRVKKNSSAAEYANSIKLQSCKTVQCSSSDDAQIQSSLPHSNTQSSAPSMTKVEGQSCLIIHQQLFENKFIILHAHVHTPTQLHEEEEDTEIGTVLYINRISES